LVALAGATLVLAWVGWSRWPDVRRWLLGATNNAAKISREPTNPASIYRLLGVALRSPWPNEPEPIAAERHALEVQLLKIGAMRDQGGFDSVSVELEKLTDAAAELMRQQPQAARVSELREALRRARGTLSTRLQTLGAADPVYQRLSRDADLGEQAWKDRDWDASGKLICQSRDAFELWLQENGSPAEIDAVREAEGMTAIPAAIREIELLREKVAQRDAAVTLLNSQIQNLNERIAKLTDAYAAGTTALSVALAARTEAEDQAVAARRALEDARARKVEVENKLAAVLQRAQSNGRQLEAAKQELQVAQDKLHRTSQEVNTMGLRLETAMGELRRANAEVTASQNDLRTLTGKLAVKQQQLEGALGELASARQLPPAGPLPPVEVRPLNDLAQAASIASTLVEQVTQFLANFNPDGQVPQARLLIDDGTKLRQAATRLCRAVSDHANPAELSTEFSTVQRAWNHLQGDTRAVAKHNGINPNDPTRPTMRCLREIDETVQTLSNLLNHPPWSSRARPDGNPLRTRNSFMGQATFFGGTSGIGRARPVGPPPAALNATTATRTVFSNGSPSMYRAAAINTNRSNGTTNDARGTANGASRGGSANGFHHLGYNGADGYGGHPPLSNSTLQDWGYPNPHGHATGYGNGTALAAQPTGFDYSHPINSQSAPPMPAVVDSAANSFIVAGDAFKQRQYDKALELTDQAIRQTHNTRAAHELRALALFALQRYDEAAAAVSVVPWGGGGQGWDWATLVSFYPSVAVYTDQLRALENYCGQNPASAPGRFVLAYHYAKQGHLGEAVQQLKRLAELQPNDTLSAGLIHELESMADATAGAGAGPLVPTTLARSATEAP